MASDEWVRAERPEPDINDDPDAWFEYHAERVLDRQEQKEAARKRRRAWRRDVTKQAAGNAIGTLLAAGVLFLGATLGGVLDDVPTGTTVGVAALVTGMLVGFLFFGRLGGPDFEARMAFLQLEQEAALAAWRKQHREADERGADPTATN